MSVVLVSNKSDLQEAIKEAVSQAMKDQVPEIVREATAKPWLTSRSLRTRIQGD